jgi:hypothetical protein
MTRLLGWQSQGFDEWMRRDTFPLINLQLGEFLFIFCYAVAGLVPLVSAFLFMLLEFYGLHLQHLSPLSLILVVIFVHFCEKFIYTRSLVTLFWMLHVLWWSKKGSGLIGAYYFQLWAKWDHWREDCVVIWANVHDRLVLLIESLMAQKTAWEETPMLHVAYGPVIKKIWHLTSHGLSLMMVLHDFLSRRITPL